MPKCEIDGKRCYTHWNADGFPTHCRHGDFRDTGVCQAEINEGIKSLQKAEEKLTEFSQLLGAGKNPLPPKEPFSVKVLFARKKFCEA